MGYSTLPNSGLRTVDYGESAWLTHFNYNWQRLNDTLLKLSALLDVDVSGGLNDGDVLWWVAASTKFKPRHPTRPAKTTTTTTSTTSSTTSSTSSTTSTSSTVSTTSSTSSSTSSTSSSSTTTAP